MRSVTMSKDLCAVWQVLKCYSVTGSVCSVTVFKCYSAQCHHVKRSLCNVTVLKCYNMQQQWYRECQMITVGLIDPSQCHRLTVHRAQCRVHRTQCQYNLTVHRVTMISQYHSTGTWHGQTNSLDWRIKQSEIHLGNAVEQCCSYKLNQRQYLLKKTMYTWMTFQSVTIDGMLKLWRTELL